MKNILIFLLACLLAAAASGQEASIARNSNLRSRPSTAGRIVAHLPTGTAVTIISRYPRLGYVRVETAGDAQTGWVWQRNVAASIAPRRDLKTPAVSPSNAASYRRVGDEQVYPDPQLTPGAPDPSVTQNNIAENICGKGWSTESVRPAASVTKRIKVQMMKAYGFTAAADRYELDHLISLQDGGCPDCVENLWPEAYGDKAHPMTQNERTAWNRKHPGSTGIFAGSLEKDLVENHIHDEICVGIPNARMSTYAKKYPATVSITLKRGQQILVTDWYACYRNIMNGNKPCE
jgi:Bacterial SH3 domain